jgi:hypothetical protein
VHSVRPVGEDERAEENCYPDDDECVREIERGPGDEVEEVRHVPETHAVDQVRDAPAKDETECDRKDRMASPRTGEEPEHQSHGGGRHGYDEACPAREQPERDPRVLDVVYRERPDDVDAVSKRERSPDYLLGDLVGGYRRPGDEEESEPLTGAGGKRSLRARDRLERVCRRPDANVDQRRIGPCGFAHRCSWARLSSMQRVA